MGYTEFKAATVDDAITNASMAFGVPSTDLEYEVIEEGTKGIFGIGKKPAVIQAKVKNTDIPANEQVKSSKEKKESPEQNMPKQQEQQQKAETEKTINQSVFEVTDKTTEIEENQQEVVKSERVVKNPENIEEILSKTKLFLDELFQAMKIETKVEINFDKEKNNINIELFGDEMGVLIGKRGNTLDALQYLISLYCNKLSDVYIRVKLDTENYRFRRRQTLEHLAKNIAYKVKKTKRPVYLEPMNPYERRIIHSTLQNDRYVMTKSEGEEPYRKVVVYLKNSEYVK